MKTLEHGLNKQSIKRQRWSVAQLSGRIALELRRKRRNMCLYRLCGFYKVNLTNFPLCLKKFPIFFRINQLAHMSHDVFFSFTSSVTVGRSSRPQTVRNKHHIVKGAAPSQKGGSRQHKAHHRKHDSLPCRIFETLSFNLKIKSCKHILIQA